MIANTSASPAVRSSRPIKVGAHAGTACNDDYPVWAAIRGVVSPVSSRSVAPRYQRFPALVTEDLCADAALS